MLSISFTDDEYMSERNIAVLNDSYENARRDTRRIAPQQLGVERIGHFGFFRAGRAEPLWRLALAWITTATGRAAQDAGLGSNPNWERKE